MKKRLITILVLALAMVLALTSCDAIQGLIDKFNPQSAHKCEHVCEICNLCTDDECTEAACAEKCEGHVPPHACESVCPDCGKCTDTSCTEDACATKCEGHVTTTLVLDPNEDNYTAQQGPQTLRIGSFDVILSSEKSRIEKKEADFLVDGDYITHDTRINFNGSATMTPATSASGEWENAIRFVTSGKGTVTIFWQHAGKPHEAKTEEDWAKAYRNVGLWDAEGNLVAQSEGEHAYEDNLVTTLAFDKAGTYYVGNLAHANYFFYVEVVHSGEEVELDPVPVYTVTFESNGGSAVDSVDVLAGTYFKKPTNPTKDNHNFTGWFTDADCTVAYNFAKDRVTADTTLYAGWEKIQGEVTSVTHTIKADDLATEKLEADKTVGIFTLGTGIEIAGKSKKWTDPDNAETVIEFANAFKYNSSSNKITVEVPGNGTITIYVMNGSSSAPTNKVNFVGPDGSTITEEFAGSDSESPVVKIVVNVTEGTWTIERGLGKTIFIYSIEVNCEVVEE